MMQHFFNFSEKCLNFGLGSHINEAIYQKYISSQHPCYYFIDSLLLNVQRELSRWNVLNMFETALSAKINCQ